MKYIRIVLAVEESSLDDFAYDLDEFIEENDHVIGAYVSASYETRDLAINHESWRQG